MVSRILLPFVNVRPSVFNNNRSKTSSIRTVVQSDKHVPYCKSEAVARRCSVKKIFLKI